MGNLLTVECQRRSTGKGQVSHQVPNFEKKEKKKRRNEKKIKVCKYVSV